MVKTANLVNQSNPIPKNSSKIIQITDPLHMFRARDTSIYEDFDLTKWDTEESHEE